MESKNARSEDTKEKITCGCGAVVIKSNLKAHLTTKKHLASTGQLASVVPKTKSKKEATESKVPKKQKKQEIQWQEPDNEDDNVESDEYEQDEEEGAFEDEVMDSLEMITQKIDNFINQDRRTTKEMYELIESVDTSFKRSHNELIALIKDLSVKMTPVQSVQSVPPLPQRANEKCL